MSFYPILGLNLIFDNLFRRNTDIDYLTTFDITNELKNLIILKAYALLIKN